jgi:nitrile hydratase
MNMARFKAGDAVRILDLAKTGHIRIPWYVREREGIVERYCGAYPNPEELAYAKPGLPRIDLYRVRLLQRDIWAEYAGPEDDTLEIEVYDHWLAPASPTLAAAP